MANSSAALSAFTLPPYSNLTFGDATIAACQLIANGSVHLLRLLRRSRQARPDGPDGLIRNHRRLERLDTLIIENLPQLPRHRFQRSSSLALLERLTEAQHRLQTACLSCRKFLADHLVRLTQYRAALGVPNQYPLTTEINQLISRNLASQRPETRLQGTILSADGNLRPIDNIRT